VDVRPIVVVVNLDPHCRQSGWVELDLDALGIDPVSPYEAHDLLTGARYSWQGPRNFVILDPGVVPAHILRLGAEESEVVR
jgi:starch synthase (maltosyl-transferring)